MGHITPKSIYNLEEHCNKRVILIPDAISGLIDKNYKMHWERATTKMIFYDLLETADWYFKTPEELHGWKKQLKNAYIKQDLPYVESIQNDNQVK